MGGWGGVFSSWLSGSGMQEDHCMSKSSVREGRETDLHESFTRWGKICEIYGELTTFLRKKKCSQKLRREKVLKNLYRNLCRLLIAT